jgi:hypothetical protein
MPQQHPTQVLVPGCIQQRPLVITVHEDAYEAGGRRGYCISFRQTPAAYYSTISGCFCRWISKLNATSLTRFESDHPPVSGTTEVRYVVGDARRPFDPNVDDNSGVHRALTWKRRCRHNLSRDSHSCADRRGMSGRTA